MKKLAIGLGAVVLLACLAFGGKNVYQYLCVKADDVGNSLQKMVPISDKIAVMEKKIQALDSEIASAQYVVASQRTDLKLHAKQVEEQLATVVRLQTELYAQQDAYDASNGQQFVSVDGEQRERAEVERGLATGLAQLEQAEKVLKHDQELLAKEKTFLAANERALASLMDSQENLVLMAKDLRIRQKLVEARKVESMKPVDDSLTEDVTALYTQIDRELGVQEELVNMRGESYGKFQAASGPDTKSAVDRLRARRAQEAAKDKDSI